MKKLYPILCLLILIACSQEDSVNKTVIRDDITYQDDLTYHKQSDEPLTGIAVWFHENGELRWKQNFLDGKQEGLGEWRYDNGQLRWTQNWKDGEQNGLWEMFRRNGQLRMTENYKNGLRDGLWEMFQENGQLRDRKSVV